MGCGAIYSIVLMYSIEEFSLDIGSVNTRKTKSKYGFCSKEVVLIVTVLECAETLNKTLLKILGVALYLFQWESMLREGTERLGLGLAQHYSILERVRGQMSGRESQQLRAPYQEGSAL